MPRRIYPMGEHEPRVEPSPRWIRVVLGDTVVADTKRALLVRDPTCLPFYAFPRADVRTDLFEPGPGPGAAGAPTRLSVRVGERVAPDAVLHYSDPPAERAALADHYAFEWSAMDRWYEEEQEVFVHARDPHKRIDAIPSSRHVRIALEGHELADSRRPHLLFETGLPTRYYLPRADVRLDRLEPSATRTRCPYKGEAAYLTARLGDRRVPDLAWTYPEPIPECPRIRDLVAFFDERVDVWVDGEPMPRPESPWA